MSVCVCENKRERERERKSQTGAEEESLVMHVKLTLQGCNGHFYSF